MKLQDSLRKIIRQSGTGRRVHGSGAVQGACDILPGDSGAGGSPFLMKLLAAAVLLAGGLASGCASDASSGEQNPSLAAEAAESVSENQKSGIRSGGAAGSPSYARAKGNAKLTIWVADYQGYNGIAKVGERFTRDTGVKVNVVHYGQADVQFQYASAAGVAPDILLSGHDRFGEWAKEGLIAQLAPGAEEKARFTGLAWDAVTIGGKIYGYPMGIWALGLICNRKLVPDAPENWEDFIALDNKLQKKGVRAIYWDYTTPYYTYPLISANGGYSFKKASDGFYDTGKTGVANEGAKSGLKFLIDLIWNGHMRKGADYGVMQQEFSGGRLGCILDGPWSWAGYDQAGIDFSVNRLPKLNGMRSRPFVSVQSFVISASSPNRDLAVDFLENYLLTDDGIRDVNDDVAIGVPALRSFQALSGRNSRIAATMENVRGGDLIPSIPEMYRFWSAFQTALREAVTGRQGADEALEDAAKGIAKQ